MGYVLARVSWAWCKICKCKRRHKFGETIPEGRVIKLCLTCDTLSDSHHNVICGEP